ncbi:MAG: adenylate/guanylate cyclase domain-containing protein [Candidatus Cloacimonetes bacterium]|nr:adenylate/guanylate cyclase domain-containing protein [Candidatus Cloacimonadota bacterium]
MKLRYHRYVITLVVIAFSWLLHQLPISKQLLGILHLRTYDLILDLTNAYYENDAKARIEDIVIVDIDEWSIATLGQHSSWPSLYFADLIDSLRNDQPLLIAFDVFFTESDSMNTLMQERMAQFYRNKGFEASAFLQNYTTDAELARAIRDAGNVYLGMFNSSTPVDSIYLPSTLRSWKVPGAVTRPISNPKAPISLLAESAYGVGFAHIGPDYSGIIHDYPCFFDFEGKQYVNFSFQACLDLLQIDQIRYDGDLKLLSQNEVIRSIPLDYNGNFFFNYYGKSQRFRYVSFADVLLGRIEDGYFAGKIILVGSTAVGLRDIKITPLDPDYPGVELHATMMMNLLMEDYVHWLPHWLSWVLIITAVLLMAFSIRYLKPLQTLLIFAIASVLLFAVFVLCFARSHLAMDYSVFMLTWLVAYFSLLVHESQIQYAEKRKVRNAFEHYVSKSVISQIMKVNDPLKVGGERKAASILFSDIRNFSGICEQLPPEEVSEFLHEHFNRSTQIVTQNLGTLDKYIGDAMLALFNVPLSMPDYQARACQTAVSIIAVSKTLRDEYSSHPILTNFQIGVGIASGEIIAGNFGSDEIFNYTGIGDKMNLSSRLESLNKCYHSSIIIDSATYEAVKEIYFCRWLDRVCVKGKDEAIDIYELIAPTPEISLQQQQLYQTYAQALKAMVAKDLKLAKQGFEQCLSLDSMDYPSRLMLERIKGIDLQCWDGIWRYDSK